MSATAVTAHIFWILSRAGGAAALLLSSMSVGVGVTLAGNLLKGHKPDLRLTHEALSLATIVALALHGLALLGDGYLRLSVVDIAVPFASGYRQPWMGLGIIAGWLFVVLGLSYYVRGRIGQRRWKTLHRLSAVAWVLGIGHSLGTGTDAGQRWFLAALVVVAVPATALGTARVLKGRRLGLPASNRSTVAS